MDVSEAELGLTVVRQHRRDKTRVRATVLKVTGVAVVFCVMAYLFYISVPTNAKFPWCVAQRAPSGTCATRHRHVTACRAEALARSPRGAQPIHPLNNSRTLHGRRRRAQATLRPQKCGVVNSRLAS